jgi:hypothetical protein
LFYKRVEGDVVDSGKGLVEKVAGGGSDGDEVSVKEYGVEDGWKWLLLVRGML